MRKKQLQAVCLAAAVSAAAIFPAYGAGPGQSGEIIPDGVTEEEWVRLNDQKMEFDEIYNRIKYFNPNMQDAMDQINDTLDTLQHQYDIAKRSADDMEDDAEELKDNGGTKTPEGMQQYLGLAGGAEAMRNATHSFNDALEKMKRPNSSMNRGIDKGVKQLTYSVNQLMIGYNSAVANRAMVQKAVEASQAGYEAQKLNLSIGNVTEADVLSAQKGLLTAQSSLMQLDNTIDSLKRTLCLMTGYSTDAMPEIAGLPELDIQLIQGIDLQSDIQKAINNNEKVLSQRHGVSKTTAKRNSKDASVEQESQYVAVQVQSCYQALVQAENAYEAACTSYNKAVLEKGKADRSRQLGMISDIAYLQAEMAYLQAEGTKQNAYNSLYQAYDTYQWAVDGIIDSAQ